MKFSRLIILIAVIACCSQPLIAQTVTGLRIPKDYRGRLDQLLGKIGKDMNLRFVYDTASLSRFSTSINPTEEKTVGGMLKMFSSAWGLHHHIGSDGYIYIGRNDQQIKELMQGNLISHIQEKEEETQAKRSLKPLRRNFSLSGELFDSKSGERIPYANVLLYKTRYGACSDANGRFILEKIPSDTCTLQVQYIGYRTRLIQLEPSLKNTPLRIELEMQSQDIAAVFITGRKDDKALQQYTGEHKMKMAPEALKLLPNVGEKDIMRGFQLMPVFGPGPMASTRASEGMSLLEIYWKNPERNTYLVVIECLEANPTYIRDTTYGISPSTRFKTEPTQDSICVLSPQSFTYLGRHRIILFRLQPEYLLLLKSNSNQSQSLQEIRANITNGFGIFSAMDSDTLSLNVVRYLF